MPKIAATDRTEEFNLLHAIAEQFGENKDCSVKAIAVVTGATYTQAHEAMAAQGREKGKGASVSQIENAITALGGTVETVNPRTMIDQYPGVHKGLKSVTTHHPARFAEVWAQGTYLFFTKGHVAGIRDGKNHDWTIGRAQRCWRIVRVTMPQATPAPAPEAEVPVAPEATPAPAPKAKRIRKPRAKKA